jgi:hypothetical protein
VGGVAVHPLQVALVTTDPAVREFQVVQEGDALRLRVALRDGAGDAPARLQARLVDRLGQLGVARPVVEVETVAALERAPGGKLRMIVPDEAEGARAGARSPSRAQSTSDVTAAGAGRT